MNQENKTGGPVVWNSGAAIGHMKQAEQEALDGAAMDKLRTLLKCLPESPYKAQMRTEVEALRQRVRELEETCKDHSEIQQALCQEIDYQAEQIKVARDALDRIRTGDWLPDWVRKLTKEALAKLRIKQ